MSQNGKGDTPRPFSVSKQTFEDNWEKTFGKKKEETKKPLIQGIELLTLIWDLWCFHGFEPSEDHKAEVRALGLSPEEEDMGKTRDALSRMGYVVIEPWVAKCKCAKCGAVYGAWPDQCEAGIPGVDPGESGWDNFCGSSTFINLEK